MWMILFLLLPLLALVYIGWHVWTLVPLSGWWRSGLVALLVLSFLLLFGNMSHLIDRMPLGIARWAYDIGSSSVFVLLYLTIIFLVLDVLRLVGIVHRTLLYQNVYVTIAIVWGLFLLFLYGNINYYHKVREELLLNTEKQLAKPVKLVLLSDLHLGYHNTRSELARWVDMINDEHPDLVLVAGDVIDMSMRPLLEENMAEELRRISAPVYACLGNHEYYSNEPRAEQFYRDACIQLLRDSCVTVGDLCIIGRDDRTNMRRRLLSDLSEQADHTKYIILLDHQPYHLEQAEKAQVDFQFSGHTHYGQVWPISWITKSIYECAFGRYQRGKTQYYVSSGMGLWGGKYRIGTHSEYVVATIQ